MRSFIQPFLEQLETRDVPSGNPVGIPNPQIDVFYLGSRLPDQVLEKSIVQNGIGKLVNSVQVGGNLPLGNQAYIKLQLLMHQDQYHGTSTVIVEALPPGTNVPTDPANGQPTTGRALMNFLGGTIPVAISPPGNGFTVGNNWELANIQKGWFSQDPPGVKSISAIPPGPNSQSDLKSPNFFLGYFALYELFQFTGGNLAETGFIANTIANSGPLASF